MERRYWRALGKPLRGKWHSTREGGLLLAAWEVLGKGLYMFQPPFLHL